MKCPECGSEMQQIYKRTPEAHYEKECVWICWDCGHEEKVKADEK